MKITICDSILEDNQMGKRFYMSYVELSSELVARLGGEEKISSALKDSLDELIVNSFS